MKNATFDLLPRDTRKALEARLRPQSPECQADFIEKWAELLGKLVAHIATERKKRGLYGKQRADETEGCVRQAFDQVTRISYYNSDNHNAQCAIRFLQLCGNKFLNLPFIPTPDLAGLTKIVEHYESL